MDSITLVLTVFIAGATSAGQAIASDAIKEAYTGLKALIQRKFAGKSDAERALTNHETDPTKWKIPLKTALQHEQALTLWKAELAQAQLSGRWRIFNASGAGASTIGAIDARRNRLQLMGFCLQ